MPEQAIAQPQPIPSTAPDARRRLSQRAMLGKHSLSIPFSRTDIPQAQAFDSDGYEDPRPHRAADIATDEDASEGLVNKQRATALDDCELTGIQAEQLQDQPVRTSKSYTIEIHTTN